MAVLNANPLTAPDWGLWARIPTAGLDEAVALSLNVNPLFVPMLWNMFNDEDPQEHDEGTAEFARRLVVARNNIQPLGALTVFGMDEDPARCRVRLADFAALAAGLGWSLPPEFPGTQAAIDPRESGTAPAAVGRQAPSAFADAFSRLLKEIERRAAAQGQPLDQNEMPGTKENLRAVACKFDATLDVAWRTFDDYMAGLCRFKKGRPAAGATNPYAKLFPEYFGDAEN